MRVLRGLVWAGGMGGVARWPNGVCPNGVCYPSLTTLRDGVKRCVLPFAMSSYRLRLARAMRVLRGLVRLGDFGARRCPGSNGVSAPNMIHTQRG